MPPSRALSSESSPRYSLPLSPDFAYPVCPQMELLSTPTRSPECGPSMALHFGLCLFWRPLQKVFWILAPSRGHIAGGFLESCLLFPGGFPWLRSHFLIYKQLKSLSFLEGADRLSLVSCLRAGSSGLRRAHTYLVCLLRYQPFPRENLFILTLLISLP